MLRISDLLRKIALVLAFRNVRQKMISDAWRLVNEDEDKFIEKYGDFWKKRYDQAGAFDAKQIVEDLKAGTSSRISINLTGELFKVSPARGVPSRP